MLGSWLMLFAIKLYSHKDIFKHTYAWRSAIKRLWFKVSKVFERSIIFAPPKPLLSLLNLLSFFSNSKQILKRRVGY